MLHILDRGVPVWGVVVVLLVWFAWSVSRIVRP